MIRVLISNQICASFVGMVLVAVLFERDVQMFVPSYDFGRPTKECNSGIDSKDEFNQMNFPLDCSVEVNR